MINSELEVYFYFHTIDICSIRSHRENTVKTAEFDTYTMFLYESGYNSSYDYTIYDMGFIFKSEDEVEDNTDSYQDDDCGYA